jgi:hypothetical protein
MNRKATQPATQREVDAAAEKLLAAGIRPTVQLVHEAVGGSPRGLRAMLEDWRNRLARRVPVPDAPPTALPEERAEVIVRQAIDSARGSLRQRLRSTRERMSALEAHPTEDPAQREADHFERQLLELQSAVRHVATKLSELAAQVAPIEKKLADVIRLGRVKATVSKRRRAASR